MTTPLTCPEKDVLVSCLYDEATPAQRERFEAHLAACASCRDELDALTRVRADLSFWQAPEPAVPVRLVADAPAPGAWAWVRTPAFGLAAAAMLVVGLAAGMARIEVRRDATGWTLRTGWGQAPATPDGAVPQLDTVALERAPGESEAPAEYAAAGASGLAAATPLPGDAAWRTELAALEARLRDEIAARDAAFARTASPAASAAGTRAPLLVALTPEMRQQVQAMVDDSEVRQQHNLALRVAEITRDFDLARRSDYLRIQQGLGRVEGRSEADAARTRDLMNYIMRVSQQGPGQ